MELHALERSLAWRTAAANAHHDSILGGGALLEAFADRARRHRQRVVAGREQRIGKALEPAAAIVPHEARAAMHGARAPLHPHPQRGGDDLVTEAHAEQGNPSCEPPDERNRDAALGRPARPRGEQDRRRPQRLRLRLAQAVAAMDRDPQRRVDPPDLLHEVVGERVVVVDEKQHAAIVDAAAAAASGGAGGDAQAAVPATPSRVTRNRLVVIG